MELPHHPRLEEHHPSHTWKETEWTPGRAYSTAGSAHSIPTSALVCMTTPMVEELNQPL